MIYVNTSELGTIPVVNSIDKLLYRVLDNNEYTSYTVCNNKYYIHNADYMSENQDIMSEITIGSKGEIKEIKLYNMIINYVRTDKDRKTLFEYMNSNDYKNGNIRIKNTNNETQISIK